MKHTDLREPTTGQAVGGNDANTASDQPVPPDKDGRGEARADLEPTGHTYTLRGHGVFERLLAAPGVSAFTDVVAGVTEVYDPTNKPFMGGAVMMVDNVVPLDGERVRIRVDSGWPEDVTVRVSLQYFA
ncbi:hypothetical protein [Streptomyces sp. NRRL S-87]|uniref:hypothetical protein n=1 Tax=Streptomyces sp. NRRL S-87 TaxID=1463920 RepID=UPI0004C19155|nr:hypothetical protein [Streptomyces sp. NRRL S-87]